MAQPFLGMVCSFGFNFAPQGWQLCQGQLIPINQNTALFSLLGTTYGGNGTSTFALPDLRGRVGISFGQGDGLSDYELGEVSGSETVTLTSGQMPEHSHTLNASNVTANTPSPNGSSLAVDPTGLSGFYESGSTPATPMNINTIAPAGGSQPHNNLQPFLVLNYCIAMEGIFPSRS